ncbi:hypothetical protein [Pollutimonas subterranea]|nr:hypothetical protein [Pollutimonas subterranea]
MALGDFFRGSEHRENAERLEAELQALRLQSKAELQALRRQSQEEIQAVRTMYTDLEAQVRLNGTLDLVATQKKIHDEKTLLSGVRSHIVTAQSDLQAARSQLQAVQKQILGAEDTVLLESFALYEPKYQFTNSVEYKDRLDAAYSGEDDR